jgi:SAM-dependent methyltransferase
LHNDAKLEAQKQWNGRACGQLEGDRTSAGYFLQVEQDRYRQQDWAREYFGYDRFSGQKVLEIGVGQGTDMMQFAKAGAECFGVDITDNHLQLTQRNFDLRGSKVELCKADATRLPFPNAFFDCVYSFGVLHHIPDIGTVIAESRRVLKPGGILMIALYYKWSAFHIFWKLLAHGIRHGWLFSKGYDGLLATIEDGADGIRVKPYVKLYTKQEVRDLMSGFLIEDLSVHQLEAAHFWPAFLAGSMNRWVRLLEPRLGWYVTCRATRPVAGAL